MWYHKVVTTICVPLSNVGSLLGIRSGPFHGKCDMWLTSRSLLPGAKEEKEEIENNEEKEEEGREDKTEGEQDESHFEEEDTEMGIPRDAIIDLCLWAQWSITDSSAMIGIGK